MMKGKATIELRDAKTSQVTEEYNMVTNCFEQLLELVSNSTNSCPDVYNYNDYLDNLANNFKTLAIDSLDAYGIRLFPTKLVEDGNLYATTKTQVGYGDTTINQVQNKGIFNNIASTKLTNLSGDTVGIRLVWDFGTDHCNGIINAITLTPSNCSGTLNPNLYGKSTVNTGYLFYQSDTRNLLTLDSKGNVIVVTEGNTIEFQKAKTGVVTTTGWKRNPNDFDQVVLATHTDLFKVYDLGDSYLTIGKKQTNNVYELLTLDHKTKAITNAVALTGDFSKYKDFCKCGNHLVLSSYNTSGETPTFHKYKLSTGVLTTFSEVPNRVNSVVGVNNMLMIKDNAGDFSCRLVYHRDNYGPYYHRTCTFKEVDGELVITSSVATSTRETYSLFANFGVLPLGIVGDTGYQSGAIHLSYLGFDSSTLFTINNLTSPIEKTDANTMKITYELTWGEVAD